MAGCKRPTFCRHAVGGAACFPQAVAVQQLVSRWSNLFTLFVGGTLNSTQIEFDSAKRDATLAERGLEFARASDVFAGRHFTAIDDRFAYGEKRFFTVGWLDDRQVVVTWTPRGEVRRIISMRKANEREKSRYADRLG